MKSELINMTQTWDKEKILFPDRNQTQDPPPPPPNTRWALYLLGFKNSWGAKSLI